MKQVMRPKFCVNTLTASFIFVSFFAKKKCINIQCQNALGINVSNFVSLSDHICYSYTNSKKTLQIIIKVKTPFLWFQLWNSYWYKWYVQKYANGVAAVQVQYGTRSNSVSQRNGLWRNDERGEVCCNRFAVNRLQASKIVVANVTGS
jgi:hypothetical protein